MQDSFSAQDRDNLELQRIHEFTQPFDASVPDWAYMPEGKPEEFGFPQESATHLKVQVWQRQEAFLAAYRECGKIGRAAKVVGLTRWAVDHWLKNDIFGFKRRIDSAHADYCEDKVEGMIDERLETPQGNRGSDILLMFKAKAEMPEKYREEVKVIGGDFGRDLINKLVALERDSKGKQGLDSGVVEGKVRELPGGDGK
jgi:hypothetical protein